MLTGVSIPDELIPDILSRLPAKTLGRFKCVSKPWKTLISDPKFVNNHLTSYANRHRQSVVFAPVFRPLVVVDFDDDQFNAGGISAVLDFEQTEGWLVVCGSCDGMVLALTATYELCLINVTIREFKILSFPDSDTVGVAPSGIYGFGYDSLNCDYKVVVFCPMFIWVYSLRNNCWKRARDSPFYWLGSRVLRSDVGASGSFVNGAIHLLGKKDFNSPRVIVAFDLCNEKFREVPKPRELIMDGSEILIGLEVRILGGCLCLTNSTTDIWVMREYGVKESWSRFSVYQPRSYHIRPILLSGDEDFLLIMNREKLVVYNVKENTSRDVECHGLLIKRNFEVRTFVGSLVSPKQWERRTL